MTHLHSFHIPVMGLGYTIDSPVKVAHYGIASAVALADDLLIERMREFYCRMFEIPYTPVTVHESDYRCIRIREYLNVLDIIVRRKFEDLKNSAFGKGSEVEKLIDMLPEMSEIRNSFHRLTQSAPDVRKVWLWVKDNLNPGAIDVNIMTKLDKENFRKGEKLPQEFNDAHAALRGFATSNLKSSVVLSAGMNPALYSYMEQFPAFYPDSEGVLQKKITLKVSDYRSALIQGKFLAKKGLWVSEFRVESGLNCGGHAFATDGYLMGPVLEEFRDNRTELTQTLHEMYVKALTERDMTPPAQPYEIRLTAQGGVGTADEHRLLTDYYGMDSVGWGTPFLLVPEATTVDEDTLRLLADAREDDLYLSDVSPLGVPFNSIRGNTKDLEKMKRVEEGRPGSPCTKQHLKLFRDSSGNPVCTASREYQKEKIAEAESVIADPSLLKKVKSRIYEKVCLCAGLASSAQVHHGIDPKSDGTAVSICPGPNLAWFDKVVGLKDMAGHIYGRTNIMSRTDRPHMFINELRMYIDHLRHKAEENLKSGNTRETRNLVAFQNNLLKGIDYYKALFAKVSGLFHINEPKAGQQLEQSREEVLAIELQTTLAGGIKVTD